MNHHTCNSLCLDLISHVNYDLTFNSSILSQQNLSDKENSDEDA